LKSDKASRGAQTLERGLALVDAVAHHPMTVQEMAEQVGLTRSTASRLVQALVSRGFLISAGGKMQLGPTLIKLGFAARANVDLIDVAAPFLQALSDKTGLCSFLGRRDGDNSLHLHRNMGRQRVIVATPVGTRRALAETSLGKALMLDLGRDEWRKHFERAHIPFTEEVAAEMESRAAAGVVVHRGPPPDMIRAAAAPIRDATGAIVAALSVATIAQYADESQLAELAPAVREAAENVSAALGYQKPEG